MFENGFVGMGWMNGDETHLKADGRFGGFGGSIIRFIFSKSTGTECSSANRFEDTGRTGSTKGLGAKLSEDIGRTGSTKGLRAQRSGRTGSEDKGQTASGDLDRLCLKNSGVEVVAMGTVSEAWLQETMCC